MEPNSLALFKKLLKSIKAVEISYYNIIKKNFEQIKKKLYKQNK